MTKLARQITPDEVAAYNKAGVVLLRGVLDLQTVNALRATIDTAVATIDQSPSGYNMSALARAFETHNKQVIEQNSQGQHDVANIMDHMRRSGKKLLVDDVNGEDKGDYLLDTGVAARLKDFKRFSQRGAAPEIAAALLNSEEVRFYNDQVFLKEPNTRDRTAYHQDANYFEINGEQCCVLWIPVDPVTLEQGVMQYIRGSHLDGRLYKPNVFVSQTPLPGSEGEDLPDIEANPDLFDIVHFNVEPGDVLVHHYRTIHGTGGNLSRYQVRRAASIRYCGDDMYYTRRPWAPKQLHHTHQLEEGEPLHHSDFPIVWSAKRHQHAA